MIKTWTIKAKSNKIEEIIIIIMVITIIKT